MVIDLHHLRPKFHSDNYYWHYCSEWLIQFSKALKIYYTGKAYDLYEYVSC
uniref:Uncharacterized protein n=1 Tax=Tetranychus urticae TaxID=32264 RepID=T1KBL2_TETUR